MVVLYWIIPESIRWLLTKQRYDEADTIIKKIAKANGATVSDEDLSNLRNKPEEAIISFKRVVTSSRIMLNFAVGCVLSITVAFLFFELAIKSAAISDNPYLDFAIASAAEFPAALTVYVVMYKCRRKVTLSTCLFCSAGILLGYIFVEGTL